MGDLAAVLRKGVGTINKVTASLQVDVEIEPWIGNKPSGMNDYGPAVPYKAIADLNQHQRRLDDGTIIYQKASIQFVTPVAPVVATGRDNPIDARDRLRVIAPGGEVITGPILAVIGVQDPLTNAPYAAEVVLGA